MNRIILGLMLFSLPVMAQQATPTPQGNTITEGQQQPIQNPAGPSVQRSGARDLQPGETVNINTADAATLERLPGIGPSLARAIVDWRAQNGNFAEAEDVMNVPNIGPRRYETMRMFLTTEAIGREGEVKRQSGTDRQSETLEPVKAPVKKQPQRR